MGTRRQIIERALCPTTVCREGEVARLVHALESAHRGQGQVLLTEGDAGVGKSRLAMDLGIRARELGMVTLWGACSEADLSLPYLPYLEAIGNHLATADLDRIRARLGPACRDLSRLFPQLDLEALPQDPSDPVQGKLRLYEGVLALLGILAAEGGLLLVIDDLQWADDSTRELTEYLGRRASSLRLLGLGTCRSEELDRRHPVATMIQRWERAGVTVVRLRPLDQDCVGEMINTIFGVDCLPSEVCDLLYQRSGGNPYALEEILREAIDRGDIFPSETGWQHRSLAQIRLPKTVRDSILRRLERLPPTAAEILRIAAVLGRSFRYRTLAAVSGHSEEVVQGALRVCVEQQLVEEDSQDEAHYCFRATLTRDAVYEDLLAPQRESLHSRVAEALSADLGTPAVDLCHHLLAARRWAQAVPLALAASQQAIAAHAYRNAATLLERVLPFLDHSGQRGELLCQLGTALLLAGDAVGAERALKDGIALLEDAREMGAIPGHRLQLGRCYWERAQPDRAQAEYERARQDLEPGPSEQLALAHVRLASMAVFDLDGERAVELAQCAMEIAERARAEAPRIWAHTFMGLGLVQLGRLDEGLAHLDRSHAEAAARELNVIAANALYNGIQVRIQSLRPLEAVARLESLRSLQAGSMASLQALRAEGQVHLWGLGTPRQALRAFELALSLAREGQVKYFETWVQPQLAVTWAQLDRLDRALDLLPPHSPEKERQDQVVASWAAMRIAVDAGRLEEAVAAALRVGDMDGWPNRVQVFLGDMAVEALVLGGRLDEARELVGQVMELAPEPDHPWLLRMRGRLALADGDPAQSESLLTSSAEIFRAAGVRHEEALTRLALAKTLAPADPARAEIQIRTALTSARERNATLEERLAREQLAELGRGGVGDDQVKEALDSLHDPKLLAGSPLLSLLPAGGQTAACLRELLVEVIEEVAASPIARDVEAGQLLRDYYVKRVGSQEVVAARLYLTRATFYRRLHRGWQIVAERLGARLD